MAILIDFKLESAAPKNPKVEVQLHMKKSAVNWFCFSFLFFLYIMILLCDGIDDLWFLIILIIPECLPCAVVYGTYNIISFAGTDLIHLVSQSRDSTLP